MTLIGNLLLGLAFLVFILFFSELYLKPAPKGGDYAVGYAWALIIYNVLLFGLLSGVVGVVGMQGGFAWVGATAGERALKVSLSWIAIAAAIVICSGISSDRSGWGGVARVVAMFAPLLLLVLSFLLLNQREWSSISPNGLQGVIRMTALAGWLFSGGSIALMWGAQMFNRVSAIAERREQLDGFEQNTLAEIDACDVQNEMVLLLVHTDRQRNPQVRERAIAKIKSRADWQEELIRRLDSGWAEEVFTFLASNEVDHPGFPPAVEKGIFQLAHSIRERMPDCRTFYPDQYESATRNVLMTVDKMKDRGVDYRAAIQHLRAAFDTPAQVEKPVFHAQKMLDKWLKSH